MAIEKYRDFILVADDVEKDEEGVLQFSVEVFTSPRGGGVRVEKQQITPDLRKELGRLERRKLDADGIISLGEKLAAVLLPGQVGEFFKGSLDMLKAGQGLRLRLRLDPALAGFPWEYMYVPRTGGKRDSTGFLVLNRRVSVARHDAMPIPGDFDDKPKKRRLLVALASPEDQTPLDLDRERDNLKEALRDVPGIDLDFVENATVQSLADGLLLHTDIFHFAGHGTFGQTGAEARYGADDAEGAILLVAEDGSGAPMPAEELAVNLQGGGVQLVVLGACETGRRGEGSVWSGVAAALMKAGIPAAVAMQYSIWDDAAIAFNRSLYRALAVGFPLDYAVSAGRLAAFNRCHPVRDDLELGKCYRDWGVPVLYLRSEQDFVLPAIPDPTKREDVARKVDDETGLPKEAVSKPPKTWWKRKRRWVFSALGAAAGVAAVVVGLFLFGVLPRRIEVPNVYNDLCYDAAEELNKTGFAVEAEYKPSKITKKEHVIQTYPYAGEKWPKGDFVTLVVSTGPPIVSVPDVERDKGVDAVKKLEGSPYNFKVVKKEKGSFDVPKGYAIETDPPAKREVPEAYEVTLYISTGEPPELAEIPRPRRDEDGRSFVVRLREAGFEVGKDSFIPKAHNSVKKGSLIGTEPPGGTKAPKGTKVKIYVSTGPLPPTSLTVPDYTGQSYRTAQRELREAGFHVIIRKTPSYTVDRDKVISQTPAGRVDAKPEEVKLLVSVGKYCPNCGRELEENTDQCENCGESW